MHFDVSADGSKIVYSTCQYKDPEDSQDDGEHLNHYEIGGSNLNGTFRRRLTANNHYDNYPA